MSTFLEMRTEVAARGFNHLSATRLGYYVNRARARLDSMHRWPYLESSVTGTSPITVADLWQIEAVTNETVDYEIELVGYKDLLGWGCDLSDTGTPLYAYRAYVSGSPVVATWQSNTDTIGVQYWKTTSDLSADGDLPAAPARFHGIIIDWAQALAYRDSDNHQAAEALQVDIDRQTAQMVDELISQQEPVHVRISDTSTDW